MRAHRQSSSNLSPADPEVMDSLQAILVSIWHPHPAMISREFIDEQNGYLSILEVWNTNDPRCPFMITPADRDKH